MVDIHLAEQGCVTGTVDFDWQLHYIAPSFIGGDSAPAIMAEAV